MLRAMRDAGFTTQTELAKAVGLAPNEIGFYMNLTRTPLRADGEWREAVLRIAAVLRCDPETLFPEQHLSRVLEKNKAEGAVSFDELESFIEAVWRPEAVENHISLQRALASLTDRERKVIERRFGLDGEGEQTLSEVAEDLSLRAHGLSSSLTEQSIRAIENSALRNLRHPRHGLQRPRPGLTATTLT